MNKDSIAALCITLSITKVLRYGDKLLPHEEEKKCKELSYKRKLKFISSYVQNNKQYIMYLQLGTKVLYCECWVHYKCRYH